MILSEHLDEILREDGTLAGEDLRAVFKRVHSIDFEEAERQVMDETRSEMKAMCDELGIDIDLSGIRGGMSREQLEAKAAELAASLREKANQAKEGSSNLDIGWHLVATDSNGVPLDTDSDGIPAYLEDYNGDGEQDLGRRQLPANRLRQQLHRRVRGRQVLCRGHQGPECRRHDV